MGRSAKKKLILVVGRRVTLVDTVCHILGQNCGDMTVLANYNEQEALVTLDKTSDPVVVCFLALSLSNGIEFLHRILNTHPRVRVIFLSRQEDWRYAAYMLGIGAAGYVCRSAMRHDLPEAIRTIVMKRCSYVSPQLLEEIG